MAFSIEVLTDSGTGTATSFANWATAPAADDTIIFALGLSADTTPSMSDTGFTASGSNTGSPSAGGWYYAIFHKVDCAGTENAATDATWSTSTEWQSVAIKITGGGATYDETATAAETGSRTTTYNTGDSAGNVDAAAVYAVAAIVATGPGATTNMSAHEIQNTTTGVTEQAEQSGNNLNAVITTKDGSLTTAAVLNADGTTGNTRKISHVFTINVGTAQLDGVLFSNPPVFVAGSINLKLDGVLLSKAPTFPAGQVNTRVVGNDGALLLEAVTADYADIADDAALDMNTVRDVRIRIKPNSWPPPGSQVLIDHTTTSASGWRFYLNSSGQLVLLTQDSGGTGGTSSDTPFISPNQPTWLRFTYDGSTINYYASITDTNDHASVTWGAAFDSDSVSQSLTNSSDDLTVGRLTAAASQALDAAVYSFALLDNGTVKVDADFTTMTRTEIAAGSFTEDSSNALTVNIQGTPGYAVEFNNYPTFPAGTISIGAGEQTLDGVLLSKAPSFPVGQLIPDQRLDGVLFSKPPTFVVGQLNLSVAGVLLSKPPAFPAGLVFPVQTLAGVLFSKPPAFVAGQLNLAVNGVLFSQPPAFPVGQLEQPQQVDGVLFSKPPAFPVGQVNLSVAGALLSKPPAFPAGQVNLRLSGVTLTKPPAFPVGALIPDQQLDGVLLSKPPTFPAGQLNQSVAGVLLAKPPSFPVGELNQVTALSGVTLTKPPTFIAGQLNLTVNGVLLSKPAAFPVGQVIPDQPVSGALLSKPPTFPAGQLNLRLSGVLLSKGPAFPVGELTQAQALSGVLLSKPPAFPAGQLDLTVSGVLLPKPPAFPVGAVSLGGATQTLDGVLLSKPPTFPAGAVIPDQQVDGVLFSQPPAFPTGQVNQSLAGVALTKPPAFPAGQLTQITTITGVLFANGPAFIAGTVTPGAVTLDGVLFSVGPSFLVGSVALDAQLGKLSGGAVTVASRTGGAAAVTSRTGGGVTVTGRTGG